jgi:hypothetical protein
MRRTAKRFLYTLNHLFLSYESAVAVESPLSYGVILCEALAR